MKQLEDMNLVDDFLACSLMNHKVYGEEAARYILECALQRKIKHLKVVPQKSWYGEEPGKHGVRLDIYLDEEDGEIFDVEPDRNSSSESAGELPRRVRFYHAKIDAGVLAAGEDYRMLRNVYVIFITTYDPFGWGRMVYTVKSGCTELPDLPYDDGARTIFLYTKGSVGDPPEDLRLLARYMEHSTAENAQSAGLARLHEMVTEVKMDREVGLAYMKSAEYERWIREEAITEGREVGIAEGKAESILAVLEIKGAIPGNVRESVCSQKNLDILNDWLLLAVQAESPEQFQKQAGL